MSIARNMNYNLIKYKVRPATDKLDSGWCRCSPQRFSHQHSEAADGTRLRSWQRLRYNSVYRFFKQKWFNIPLSLGLAFIAFQQYRHIRNRQHEKIGQTNVCVASELEVKLYKMLPLRTLSRWWGWINSVELPVFMRSPILKAYVRAFGCDINEALSEDLKEYKNLGEFFRRSLKPGVRPISADNGVVSPSDGTILYIGKAINGKLEQVKGITYSVRCFLGPQTWDSNLSQADCDYEEYQRNLLKNNSNNNTDLYHCIIYLAPGDYHRFHSPAQWKVLFRRHFPGELLSVRPTFARWFPGLFHVNERVVYTGEWQHGFFSMAAVGATNVGSVRVYFDKDLKTNEKKIKPFHGYRDLRLKREINLDKGDAFGEFNLGSTIVLLFEGPKNMQFKVNPGQKVKYGQTIGCF